MKIFGVLTFCILCFNFLAAGQKTVKKATGKAERSTHTLPDGTVIFLNAQTTVTHPAAFEGNNAILTVNGEVFMNWKSEPNKRFTVTVPTDPPTLVSCLGACSINVTAYVEDSITKVAVLDGSVAVLTGTTMKKAKRGQVAIVQNKMITIISDTDYVQKDTNWINRGPYFQDWPLRLIFSRLNRCRLDNFSLPRNADFETKITLLCPYDTPIDTILRSINMLDNSFTYQIKDNRVKILPKKRTN